MIVKAISISLAIGLTAISSGALAEQKFVPVEPLNGHPPFFISWESVKREGPNVSLTYLLETPTGSNIIDATIDCEARTFVTTGLRIHPETLPPGAVRKLSPEPPQPIGKKSTFDVLANIVCK
jgi:hypothetical protein